MKIIRTEKFAMNKEKELIEELAELEHKQWWDWAKDILKTEDITEERAKRWKEDSFKPYKELSEEQKDMDREWAEKVLKIVNKYKYINKMKIIKTKKYIKISVSQKEKKDFFIKRTNKHIELVQNAAKKIVKEYGEYKKLLEQVKNHDDSKFEEPEMTPYIELTWAKKENKKEKPSKEVEEATLHHVKNNRHHPEYHLDNKNDANISSSDRDKSDKCVDAKNMDDISIAEMVADWQAMSEELGTNTAREWFDDVKNVRWKFSREQEKMIDKLLKVFD